MKWKTYSEIRRFIQICSVVTHFTLDMFVSSLYRPRGLARRRLIKRIMAFIIRMILRRPAGVVRLHVRLRLAIEKLGPTYIKLGQILSLRDDIIPERITRELSKFQTEVPAFPYEEARRVIEREFNRPIRHLFIDFEPKPIGSASLAQAHMAFMHDGKRVVVKVQRPGIVPLIMIDLAVMSRIAWLLAKIPGFKEYQPDKLVEEFADYTIRELDFTQEGKYTDIFRENFKEESKVIVPKVYWELTTRKVLTMEYFNGVKPYDSHKLKHLGIDGPKVASVAARILVKQLFMDGFFHPDLHPGNLLVVGRDRLCVIDLGMIGSYSGATMNNMFLYYYYLIIEEFEAAARYLVSLTRYDKESDTEGFKKEIVDIGKRWSGAGFKNYSLGKLIVNTINAAAKFKHYFNRDVILAFKAIATVETVGHILDPEMNLANASRPLMTEIFILRFSPAKLAKPLLRSLPDYLDFMEKAPANILKTAGMISSGKFQVELKRKKAEFDEETPSPWQSLVPVTAFIGSLIFLFAPSSPGGSVIVSGISLPWVSLAGFAVTLWYVLKAWQKK